MDIAKSIEIQKKTVRTILGNPVPLNILAEFLKINCEVLRRMARDGRLDVLIIKGKYYMDIDSFEEMILEV